MRKTLLALVLAGCAALGLPAVANASPARPVPVPAAGTMTLVYPICFNYPQWWSCRPHVVGIIFCPCVFNPEPWWEERNYEGVDWQSVDTLGSDPRTAFYNDLGNGLSYLAGAMTAGSPDQAASMRAEALDLFTEGAQQLGGTRLTQPMVGTVDPNLVFVPDSMPWRQMAGSDLTNGFTLLQQSLNSPNQQQLRAQAAADFNAANMLYVQHEN